MNVKGKYLKDESGTIFSPITSGGSVYYDIANKVNIITETNSRIKYKVLYR